jgi:hypothetical protein
MDTNRESGKRGDGGQENHPQPHYNLIEQPPYDWYKQGITEAHKGWIEVIRSTRGRYLVTVATVWALYEIAREFLEGGRNLDDKSFFGTILVAGMLLTIAIISLRRIENTDAGQKENREKGKDESAESGTGGISQGQNRRTSTRNRGSNTNGGRE